MIPKAYITGWRSEAPWVQDVQVEQDLIISRALVELFSKPKIGNALAFRGGTALHKLHFEPPRYSEDIDLVQIPQEPIGPTIDNVRDALSPWLGKSENYEQKEARFTINYEVKSEPTGAPPIRLKVEINTREHFSVTDLRSVPFQVSSRWFEGEANIQTYNLYPQRIIGNQTSSSISAR
jgi:predicted nucleotidyltransferase component of viral defense system